MALVVLDRMSTQRTRVMSVEILAEGRQFPTTHVESVFARNHIVFEPREISQSDDVTVKYHVAGPADVARGSERSVDGRGRRREVGGLGTPEAGSPMSGADAKVPDRLVTAVDERREC